MLSFGLFEAAKDDSAKTLAASLGVVGAVLSAVVTLIGIVVKYSIDERNAQQTAVESSRNFWLSIEAEKRNPIDVAIRAVDLLCENNQDTTMHQAGGALLALVSLGELELAVSLLATLWPEYRVSPQVAEVILRKALLADSDNVKGNAAAVLANNAKQIHAQVQGQDYFYWPLPDLTWSTNLPANCRLSLVYAACEWFILELEEEPDQLPYGALVLHQALADTIVSEFALACLRPVRSFHLETWTSTSTRVLSVSEIIRSLEAYSDELESNQALAYQERVEAALARR